ncbi:MAG: arginine--tRNA ligase, partial [Clostridia bacterium]|nr:arginine--tRNA ligase [Clostridia bacterium]
MQKIKNRAAALIADAASRIWNFDGLTAADYAALLEYPPDTTMGDLAFPCFKLSRELRMAPPKIAASFAEGMTDEYFTEINAVGGYLNFKIAPKALEDVLADVEKNGAKFGSTGEGEGKTVVLDYSSPNVSKPFHIGHLGTTVIGHSLKLIHEFEG